MTDQRDTPDDYRQGDGFLAPPDADWTPTPIRSTSPHVWRKASDDPRCVCHDRTMEEMLADGTYTPDTRTPSAEGCICTADVCFDEDCAPCDALDPEEGCLADPEGSDAPSAPTETRCGHGKPVEYDPRHGWLHVRTGVGCEKPPSAPNRAPTDEARCHCGRRAVANFLGMERGMCAECDATRCDADPADCPYRTAPTEGTVDRDALVERLRYMLADYPDLNVSVLANDAAAALEDLARENERLRAERESWQILANSQLRRAQTAEGQVAAVRALCDEGDRIARDTDGEYGTLLGVDEVRAALDTAPEDRRPEDGYGTDNVPGGWGGRRP